MDLKTISQQDFLPYECQKTKSAKYEKPDSSRVLKFAGVSHYRSEYPHWGHYEFINIGDIKRSYLNANVKLSPFTTYTQNFCQDMKVTRTQSQKKINVSNPLTACGDFFGQTTSRDTFRGFQKGNFPERVKNKAFGIVPLESPVKSYDSMYKTEYVQRNSPVIFPKKKFLSTVPEQVDKDN